jgi:hypothetical protein
MDCKDMGYTDVHGNRKILAFIDHYSDYVWLFNLKAESAVETLASLKVVVREEGPMKWLRSDFGANFIAAVCILVI